MGLDPRSLSLDPRLFVQGTDDLPWGAWLNNAKRIKLLLVKCNSCVLPFLKWLRHVWSASTSTFEKWLAMETGSRDGSVGQVLALQAQRSEFTSQNPCEKAMGGVCKSNYRIGSWGRWILRLCGPDSWAFSVSSKPGRDPASKMRWMAPGDQRLCSGFHTHTHEHTCQNSHTWWWRA